MLSGDFDILMLKIKKIEKIHFQAKNKHPTPQYQTHMKAAFQLSAVSYWQRSNPNGWKDRRSWKGKQCWK